MLAGNGIDFSKYLLKRETTNLPRGASPGVFFCSVDAAVLKMYEKTDANSGRSVNILNVQQKIKIKNFCEE